MSQRFPNPRFIAYKLNKSYIKVIYAYSYLSIYPLISSRSAQTVKYINNVNFVSISGILPVEWSVRLIQHL